MEEKLAELLKLCVRLTVPNDFAIMFTHFGMTGNFDIMVTYGRDDDNWCSKCSPRPRTTIHKPCTDSEIDAAMTKLTALHDEWRKEHPLEEK